MNGNFNEGSFGRQPREYDFYDEIAIADAREAVSKTTLGLFLYSVVSSVALTAVCLILQLILGERYAALASSPYFYMPMGTLFIYLVGLPILMIIIRRLPVRKTGTQNTARPVELLAAIPVAQFMLTLGANIGGLINEIISSVSGAVASDPVAEMTAQTPVWLLIVLTVFIGPLAEEFIFRKLLLERLSVFGNIFGIVLTSLLFGLFHGNVYQAFYAAGLGLVLGFVAVKSGSWLYSLALHALVNFFNGVLPTLLEGQLEDFYVGLEAYLVGDADAFAENIEAFMIGGSYAIVQLMLSLIGMIILIYSSVKRLVNIKSAPECAIPAGGIAYVTFANVGMVLFLVMSVGMIVFEYVDLTIALPWITITL